MNSVISHLDSLVRAVDTSDIITALVLAAILAILAYPTRLLSNVRAYIKRIKPRKRYLSQLRSECKNLIVIGKKEGFDLGETFVPLEVVSSDLTQASGENKRGMMSLVSLPTCVLTGGPGAGKSTMMKKRILDSLNKSKELPLFLRLPKYAGAGHDSLEEAFGHILGVAGFEEPVIEVKRILIEGALCVLDGLDEVKLEKRPQVINDINSLYNKYFSRNGTLLITCRKEAYLDTPLDLTTILEVRPLNDAQIREFANKWPRGFPDGKSPATFWEDLQSTPKIHELARSPLLLVGGLLQYTESNTGIPDERYKYLQRVANWLIFEWAQAQDHPPDPFRSMYDRLLPKLAFEMHTRNVTELSNEEVVDLFRGWLPQLGFEATRARAVLGELRSRTGIVSRDKNNVIFSQQGMQEYFCSVEINVSQMSPTFVGEKAQQQWWRESLLLAVAQRSDPDDFLDELFKADPVLGAAAVAECPTPSLYQQERAINVCLEEIDDFNDAIKTPVVQMIRKIDGKLAEDLMEKLEDKLIQKKPGKFVGPILARAGTVLSNQVLSRNPGVWATCLAGAGFLSDSFASRLFEWIEDEDEDNSRRAADTVLEVLERSTFTKLLELLPKLNKGRSDYIARRMLGVLVRTSCEPELTYMVQRLASKIAPYVSQPRRFVRDVLADKNEALFAQDPEVKTVANIATLFAILEQYPKLIEPEEKQCAIEKTINWSRRWANSHRLLLGLMAAGLIASGVVAEIYFELLLMSSFFAFMVIIALPVGGVGWVSGRRQLSGFVSWNLNLQATLSAAFVLVMYGVVIASPDASYQLYLPVAILISSVVVNRGLNVSRLSLGRLSPIMPIEEPKDNLFRDYRFWILLSIVGPVVSLVLAIVSNYFGLISTVRTLVTYSAIHLLGASTFFMVKCGFSLRRYIKARGDAFARINSMPGIRLVR